MNVDNIWWPRLWSREGGCNVAYWSFSTFSLHSRVWLSLIRGVAWPSFLSLPLCKFTDDPLSIFLCHWIFQGAENADLEKEKKKPRSPGTIWTKSCTPECFYSWRKRCGPSSVSPLCFSLLISCVLSHQNVQPFMLKHVHTSTVWLWPDVFLLCSALPPFHCAHEKLRFVLQSHYVCNWISAEPFRAVWLSF